MTRVSARATGSFRAAPSKEKIQKDWLRQQEEHNRSGTISVVVVDKSGGRFTEIHRAGVPHYERHAGSQADVPHHGKENRVGHRDR